MFRFHSLIPSVQVLHLERLMPLLQHQFRNDFTIANIEYDSDEVTFVLQFTDNYVKTWSERWSQQQNSELITILQLQYGVLINKYGIITIVADINQDFAEMEQHFKEFCQKLIMALENQNYKIAKVPTGTTGVLIYTSGQDVSGEVLADSVITHLNKYQREISNVFGKITDDIISGVRGRIHPILEKFNNKNRSYDALVDLQINVNKFSFFLKMLSITVSRVNSSIKAGKNWDIASRNAMSMRELFLEIDKNLELVLRTYSDYIGTSGMFATLGGVGIGVFFVNFSINEEILRWIVALAGLTLIGIAGIIWGKAGIKELIIKQLQSLSYIIK